MEEMGVCVFVPKIIVKGGMWDVGVFYKTN